MVKQKYREGNDDETVFLKKFQTYGVSLYKTNDENLNSWSRLEFSSTTLNNTNAVPTSCN
ncbi:hypothetical protein [Psychroserpens sp.]|uniref:hypothetical protein n=1 Tax=Psychroserpens sp. TaxID=2020870 RepID=UPI0039E706EB